MPRTRLLILTAALALPLLAIADTLPLGKVAFRWWNGTSSTGASFSNAEPGLDAGTCSHSERVQDGGALASGLNLSGLESYYICADLPAGQAFAGAGTADTYFYDHDKAAWVSSLTSSESVTSAMIGKRRHCWPKRDLSRAGYGCLYVVPNGITTSGNDGGSATMQMTATGVF